MRRIFSYHECKISNQIFSPDFEQTFQAVIYSFMKLTHFFVIFIRSVISIIFRPVETVLSIFLCLQRSASLEFLPQRL